MHIIDNSIACSNMFVYSRMPAVTHTHITYTLCCPCIQLNLWLDRKLKLKHRILSHILTANYMKTIIIV